MQVYARIYMYMYVYAKTVKNVHLRSFSDPHLSVLAKPKAKAKPKKVEEVLVLNEDITFENEVKKPEVKAKPKDTKETKSSLTFGE